MSEADGARLIEGYLELGLRLGRHIDGFVDAYYGPREPAERIAAEPPRDPAALVRDGATLLETIRNGEESSLQPDRRRWLEAQLTGLETVAQKLAGESVSYSDEVERCYGVRPRLTPEQELEAVHRSLDDALPGSGNLAERYAAWLDRNTVPAERLGPLLDRISTELRARTSERFGLPEGEDADIELVTGQPWSAFNYYLGGLRSRVAVNVDLPVPAPQALHLVAHEVYPGHHTEHASKEQRLVRDRDFLEETALLVGTPQSLVSEGIAEVGVEVLLGDEQEDLAAEHLARAGVDYDPEAARVVKQAAAGLQSVAVNAALMLHEGGASREEARDYVVEWGLRTKERGEKAIDFITDPTWRSYIITYSQGLLLCRRFVQDRPDRFQQLLTEQLLPADLVEP